MSENVPGSGERPATAGGETLPRGAFSALLEELAAAPSVSLSEDWERRLKPGAVVGRFELLREVGRGGFGIVYEARDRDLGRLVAFKAIRPGPRSVPRDRWLLDEAEAVAQLNHPNIVTLHDVGTCESGPYLILELLRGETLEQRLMRGPLPLREALRVAVGMARGLEHAHAAGVIHRDLKPGNVFLTEDGGVKLLDFGLAHFFEEEGTKDAGTRGFMAPEQRQGLSQDARADVYAAAVVLHVALTGRLPFGADAEPGKAQLPPAHIPGIPPALQSLVGEALAGDPERRPRDGGALLQALLRVQRVVEARSLRRWGARAALAIAVAAAMVGGAVTARMWQQRWRSGERVRVAVVDFANETGEKDLDGLSSMFITSLEQSHRLSVLTRSRMLDLARQIAGVRPERIDEVLGREVARRAGAAGVATGTIRRLGSVYAIDVHVMDPASNEYLVAAREQAGRKEEILDVLDRLSERMRAGLKERAGEIEGSRVKVAEATTRDLAAYEHFLRGEQLYELQQASDEPAYAAAREEYGKAVALAPDFAMAHYRIALTLDYEHIDAQAREALALATKHMDRAAPKERAYIQALASRLEKRIPDAIRQYQEILASYPGEKEAWQALAHLMGSRDMGYDHQRAAEYARKALELAPDYAPAWEDLLLALYARGQDAALLEEAQRYAQTVTSVGAWEYLGHAQLVAGRPAEAEKTFARIAATMPGSTAGPMGLALTRLQWLDLPGAEQEYRWLAGASDPKRAREGLFGLSWVSAYRGRYREAAARLDPVIRIDERLRDAPDLTRAYGQKVLWSTLARGKLPEDVVNRGLAAIDPGVEPMLVYRHFYWFAIYAALSAGRLDEASRLRDRGLAAGPTHVDRLVRMAEARARGQPDEARSIAAALYSPRDLSQGLPLYAAEWALAEGRAREAVARASQSLDMPIFPPHTDVAGFRAALWPRSLLLRARAHQAAGDRDAARADLDRLLETWRGADREAPDVALARRLRAQLEGRAR